MAELFNTNLFDDANLVSYWRMEGNSNDSKGSNNGTDTSITYSVANGKFNQGAGLNGSTSKIVISDAASLKPTGNFSIGGWFNTSSTGNQQQIFQSWSLNTNYAGFVFYVNSSNKLAIDSGKNTGTIQNTDWANAVTIGTVTDGIWHLGVATSDGSNLKIYIDATTAVSTTWANNAVYAGTNYPRIGCGNNSGSDISFLNGAIDDVFLLSRALTANEVLLLYYASGGANMGFEI